MLKGSRVGAQWSMLGVVDQHQRYVQPMMSKLVVTPLCFFHVCTFLDLLYIYFSITSNEFNVGHSLMYVNFGSILFSNGSSVNLFRCS